MKRNIFGTIKSVSCDSNLQVQAIAIIPTSEYSLKGTDNEKKRYALLRIEHDVGSNISFEYSEEVLVTGHAVSQFSTLMKCGQIVGFIVEDLDETGTPDINFNGVVDTTVNGGGYSLKEIVLR